MKSGMEHPALGRFLHEQASIMAIIDTEIPNHFGGTSITGHNYEFYDGADRSAAAAVLIENFNTGVPIRPEPEKWDRRLVIKFIAEDIPQAQNRVEPGPNGEVKVTWTGHHRYAHAGLALAQDNVQRVIPVPIEDYDPYPMAPTEAHIQGTTRFGTDPRKSVLDHKLRLHSDKDIFVLGSGAFPSCSPANPTLTLSALSLLSGRSLN